MNRDCHRTPNLTSPVCRISKRTEQQGHVMMLGRIANRKDNHDLGIEAFDLLRGEVSSRLEGQSINASVQGKTVRQQISDATIRVGCPFTNLLPTAVGTLEFQPHPHAVRRTSARGIENMCSDCAHSFRSFSNLSRVIFRCSSAAADSSALRSFCNRVVRIASISAEDLPVAQTMKMKPKRSSYS